MSSSAIEPTGRPTPSTPRDQAERSSPGHGSSVNDDPAQLGQSVNRKSGFLLGMMRNGECKYFVAFLIGYLVGGEDFRYIFL